MYVNYAEYIQSAIWKRKRGEVWKKYKVCQICGLGYNLIVHHFHYDTLGFEDIDQDVILLCASCHASCHFIGGIFRIPLIEHDLRKRFETLKFRRTKHILNLRPSHIIEAIIKFTSFVFKQVYKMYSVRKSREW